MATSTITSKGQVTIPKKIRQQLNLKKGDQIDFQLLPDGEIRISPQKRSYHDLYGILNRENQKPVSVHEMDEGVAEYFLNKYRPS